MALARALAVAVVGVTGHLVEVEADLGTGLPGLTIIGLPDAALQESRDRIRAAVTNSGQPWPDRRITLGLFPATLPKSGSAFDLAMALAVLAADGQVPAGELRTRVLIGELALDGRVRPVRGVLPAVLAAQAAGVERVVVPAGNAAEALLVPGTVIEPVADLRGAIGLVRGLQPPGPVPAPAGGGQADEGPAAPDLAEVAGQSVGRLAVEVAAAGGHHLYLQGPPGSGKTMLAERLPGVLPDLDPAAALEVTAIHSVAGLLPAGAPLVRRPPYRSPHHSATAAALIGAGSATIRPGLACQAHRGALFLDEAPEFSRTALDALRQPLESGVVEISRARMTTRFPARFQLVLAANPCPCARARAGGVTCECPSAVRRRYLGRLSGPLLDRIDIQLELSTPTRAELRADLGQADSSARVAARVAAARTAMAARLAGTPWRTNAEVPGATLRHAWKPAAKASRAADRAYEAGHLTARGLDRVLRVAWTLADLAGLPSPTEHQVNQALSLRIPVWAR